MDTNTSQLVSTSELETENEKQVCEEEILKGTKEREGRERTEDQGTDIRT